MNIPFHELNDRRDAPKGSESGTTQTDEARSVQATALPPLPAGILLLPRREESGLSANLQGSCDTQHTLTSALPAKGADPSRT